MKTFKIILFLALIIPFAGIAQTSNNKAKTTKTDKVEAYYFHNTARCMTCKTVEAETKKDLEILYPDLVKQGKISFQALNLEDKSNEAIAEKLQVSGQTLLLVKGDEKINITNEGFLYAVTNPDKLKSVIKEKVDGLLDM